MFCQAIPGEQNSGKELTRKVIDRDLNGVKLAIQSLNQNPLLIEIP